MLAAHPRVEALFRALADPTRLRILHLLLDRELCVGDLVTLLGQPQPTASRHLAYLRRVGLVRVRKNGWWAFYALNEPDRELHAKLLDCVRASADDFPLLGKDARARRALLAKGGCCPKPRLS
jgi:ArsR family transcriptional regulator